MQDKHLDIINSTISTNSYGDILVLEYIGKEKEHMYKIKFINTGNEEIVSKSSIKRHSCVDNELKEQKKKENKVKKIQSRKDCNVYKDQQIIYTNRDTYKVLALDQSTTGCAYSIFIKDKLIKYGKIDTKKIDNTLQRIIHIRDYIQELIKKENIDIMVIEDIYMYYNVETFKTLAKLFGTLEVLAYENKIIFLSQIAYHWKKGVGLNLSKYKTDSKRREYQKEHSIQLANELFALDLKDDDISDSILIGYHTVKNCIKKKEYEDNIWS